MLLHHYRLSVGQQSAWTVTGYPIHCRLLLFVQRKVQRPSFLTVNFYR